MSERISSKSSLFHLPCRERNTNADWVAAEGVYLPVMEVSEEVKGGGRKSKGGADEL